MPDINDKKVGFLLERSFRVTKLSFIQVFKELDVDITPDQWVIIDALYHEGQLTQKELTEKSFKDAPTVSRIIEKMAAKNYVKKVAGKVDRRQTFIQITASGSQLVEKCQPKIEQLRAKSWESLSEQDYEDFRRIMNRLFLNLSEKPELIDL
ncbi:MAG: MarR family transcriptional regulator [Cyclobacteriaceae bacterium]